MLYKILKLCGLAEALCSIVVDFSAELGCHENLCLHDFLSLVVGQINLEEAGMSLGELEIVAIAVVVNLVVVTEIVHVGRQTLTTPDVLQVLLLLELFHGLHDAPEHLDDAMVLITVVVSRDLLDGFDVHNLVTGSSDFYLFPSEHVQDVSRDDYVDSLLDPVHLFLALSETSLHHEVSKLINIGLGDHLAVTSRAQFDFLLVAQNSGEVLFNTSFEISIAQKLSILA